MLSPTSKLLAGLDLKILGDVGAQDPIGADRREIINVGTDKLLREADWETEKQKLVGHTVSP